MSSFPQTQNEEDSLLLCLWEAISAKDSARIDETFSEIDQKDRLKATRNEGQTILHHAVETGDEPTIITVLERLNEIGLEHDLKWKRNDSGLTPVHLAVKTDQPSIVNHFFSSDNTSSLPFCRNSSISSLYSSSTVVPPDNSDLIQLALSVSFQMARIILDNCLGNPATLCDNFNKIIDFNIPRTLLETTVPLVVVGDSGAGKSSLIRTLQLEGTLRWLKHFVLCVPGADTHTAGIIPTHFESVWFGKVVFFDLSSHREFVHEAILNCGSLVDAIFLIVVNLSDSKKKVTQQIVYWLEFIRYHYSKVASTPPNVMIIGSHLLELMKLGAIVNRGRFRVHSLPRAMENIDQQNFNIIRKIEMDCRKTSPENAILRYDISAQCNRIRQSVLPLPSKCYILHAIVDDLVSKQPNEIKAITIADLLGVLQSQRPHCRLFHGTVDEVLALCNKLHKLNLLLVLKNKESIPESWIVPDSYPFLCRIEEAIFPQTEDQPDPINDDSKNGVLTLSTLKEKLPNQYTESHTDLLIMLMIHYKYCEEIKTRDNEICYFFPHLLKPLLDVPQWDKEDDRFMFAWTIAPESDYHYFLPHLVHHFLLQLSQEEELCINNLERATRSLAWGDPSGVEVIVHIHSSQRLLVSMRSTPDHQLNCLKLRKLVLRKIGEILKSLKPDEDIQVVESFIPVQRRAVLPHINNDPLLNNRVRLYATQTVKEVIRDRKAAVQPSNHATPLALIDDLLFFEPYYHIGNLLRDRIHQSSDDNITQEDYYDIGMNLGSAKLRLLDALLDNIEQPLTDVPIEDQIRLSYLRLMARHGGLTYRQLRDRLDSISFFELEDIATSNTEDSFVAIEQQSD